MIRRGKVPGDACGLFNVFVAVELCAVVSGDGAEQLRAGLEYLSHALVHGGAGGVFESPDDGEAAFSFHECDYAVVLMGAMN